MDVFNVLEGFRRWMEATFVLRGSSRFGHASRILRKRRADETLRLTGHEQIHSSVVPIFCFYFPGGWGGGVQQCLLQGLKGGHSG